jgi:hypothetical protein
MRRQQIFSDDTEIAPGTGPKNRGSGASPGARASQTILRFFRFLRYNGSIGHAFVLHQRFELRQGDLQNLNPNPKIILCGAQRKQYWRKDFLIFSLYL